MFDLEMLGATGVCAGIENYSRYLTGRKPGEPPPTLFEYLPDNALVFVDESHVTVPQLGGMYRGDFRRKATLAEYGFRLPSCMDNRPLRFEEWDAMRPQTICVSATPGPWEMNQTQRRVRRAGHSPDRADRPAGRRAAGAHAGRRSARRSARHGGEGLPHAGHDADQAHGRGPHRISARAGRARALHAFATSTPSSASRSSATCGSAPSTCWSASICCARASTFPNARWSAILDADKEGFLRSETSLVQTIGRAARNVDGRVILYADKITGSMERAMAETNRRRAKQKAYNVAQRHHARRASSAPSPTSWTAIYERDHVTVDTGFEDAIAIGHNFEAVIADLEKQMKEAAGNLEFEEAARLRDEIKRLRDVEMAVSDDPTSKVPSAHMAGSRAVRSQDGSSNRAPSSKGGRSGTRAWRRK